MKTIILTCDICKIESEEETKFSSINAYEKFHASSGGDNFLGVNDICHECAVQLKNRMRLSFLGLVDSYRPGDKKLTNIEIDKAYARTLHLAEETITAYANYVDMHDLQVKEGNKTRLDYLNQARHFEEKFKQMLSVISALTNKDPI